MNVNFVVNILFPCHLQPDQGIFLCFLMFEVITKQSIFCKCSSLFLSSVAH